MSRLFPTGGGAAPEDPEAVAPAPPPPPPWRPSSIQRKPVPAANPRFAIPTPAAASRSDDELAQQASLDKEAAQHQPAAAPATPLPAGRWRRRARLDAAMPPNRRYLGMRRRVFLVVAAAVALLLILIIGLAAGLSTRKNSSQGDLPLPGRDGGATHEGELTFYHGLGLGACGGSHGDGDMIAAVAWSVFDAAANKGDTNPNDNPICGKKIRVQRGDRSVDVTVVDRCEGCQPTDLDLSPSAFQRLAREEDGRVVGQWRWL